MGLSILIGVAASSSGDFLWAVAQCCWQSCGLEV